MLITIRLYDPEEIEEIDQISKERIINLYLENKESLRDISDQFDCRIATILKILRESNIEVMKIREL